MIGSDRSGAGSGGSLDCVGVLGGGDEDDGPASDSVEFDSSGTRSYPSVCNGSGVGMGAAAGAATGTGAGDSEAGATGFSVFSTGNSPGGGAKPGGGAVAVAGAGADAGAATGAGARGTFVEEDNEIGFFFGEA